MCFSQEFEEHVDLRKLQGSASLVVLLRAYLCNVEYLLIRYWIQDDAVKLCPFFHVISFSIWNLGWCSVQNLELVETLSLQTRPKKNRGCLFEMLNTTKTVGG